MNQPNTTEAPPIEATLEVLAPSAIEALERASIDVQVSTAHAYPRSVVKFKQRALEMAQLDVETAESCCYSRPVGKKRDASGQMVEEYAEGMSIRLAEIVAASYGNLRVSARIVDQTPRYVKCEGVAHDLESNYAAKSESFEPTVKKDGTPYSEGMRAVVAKACLSKAFRDATFKVVPRALCKPIYEAAKKTAAGEDQSLEDRRKRAKAWLAMIKVEDARLFQAFGVKGWEEITTEHLTTITGLRTAIKDGDVKPEDAFPPLGAEVKKPLFGKDKPADTASQSGAATPASNTPAAENKPDPTDLEKIRALIVESKRDEGVVLQYLRNIGTVEESLSSLDEVYKINPSAIASTLKSWKTIVKKIPA